MVIITNKIVGVDNKDNVQFIVLRKKDYVLPLIVHLYSQCLFSF